MRDAIIKLRILFHFISNAFDSWRHEVWNRELDELYCCDGRECVCGGLSVLEVMGYQTTGEGE